MAQIRIENDGPSIVSSNYWGSELDHAGTIFVSCNAGAIRILLPRGYEDQIDEMRTSTHVVVSRGPWQSPQGPEALEFLFEDNSEAPYSLLIGVSHCDRLPLATDANREWTCSVWTAPRRGKPHKALERNCHYRLVEILE